MSTNCEEAELRIESQERVILKLNKRVTELSVQVIDNQTQCTNSIIQKQKEMMSYIDGLITELENSNRNGRAKSTLNLVRLDSTIINPSSTSLYDSLSLSNERQSSGVSSVSSIKARPLRRIDPNIPQVKKESKEDATIRVLKTLKTRIFPPQ